MMDGSGAAVPEADVPEADVPELKLFLNPVQVSLDFQCIM